MRQAAFRTVLNSRLQNDVLFVLDGFALEAPKTKEIVKLLGTLGIADKKVLFLTSAGEENIALSARNLPKVKAQGVNTTSLVDVLGSEIVLCTKAAWAELEVRVSGKNEVSA